MNDRLNHDFDHRWHVAINRHASPDVGYSQEHYEAMRFMYEAKSLADEVPRLVRLFGMERRGELAAQHHQCSHDHQGQEVPDNHLTCCLGVECRSCPHLAALDAAELSDEERDTAKAWTCAAHIVSQGGDQAREGYILTTDDQMYWSNLYQSLAAGDPDDGPRGGQR